MRPSFQFLFVIASLMAVTGNAQDEQRFQFAHRISPLLAKAGCSAAECHGGATGQGGFKLSLFADDPQLDYEAITQELDGRRIDLLNPEQSLFLKKPMRNGLKHKGGRLIREDDSLHKALVAWIENGAPYQQGATELLTDLSLKTNGDEVRVMATFNSQGKRRPEDITHLARLSSSNEQVATVDDSGTISMHSAGEAWIMARYGHLSARLAVQRSFNESIQQTVSSDSHPLDIAWKQRLTKLGLEPAKKAPMSTVARRLHFDLTGRPPSPFELNRFLNHSSTDRISDTADRLMMTKAFKTTFARHIGAIFEVPEASNDPRNSNQRNNRLRAFFLKSLEQDQPLDTITRNILLTSEASAAWKHLSDPRDRAEYVGRTMLGMRIGCARCHNHPLDRWTQQEHLQFSAFFSDPRPAPGGGMMEGRFFLPGSGAAITPVLLPLSDRQAPQKAAHNESIAWLVLEGGEDTFARNMANRLFGILSGRPLVDQPDDHRLTNPAVHEPVLELLSTHLKKHRYDLRSFVKFVVTSDLYAASSKPPSGGQVSGDPEETYFARRTAKALSSQQYKRAIEHVLGVSLPHAAPPDSPLARQLYVMNSGIIQEGLKAPGNQVDAIFDFQPNPKQQLIELYQLVLSRNPRQDEIRSFLPTLEKAQAPVEAGRQLAFALLASREFGSLR